MTCETEWYNYTLSNALLTLVFNVYYCLHFPKSSPNSLSNTEMDIRRPTENPQPINFQLYRIVLNTSSCRHTESNVIAYTRDVSSDQSQFSVAAFVEQRIFCADARCKEICLESSPRRLAPAVAHAKDASC